jgi:hypothetical protein
MISIGLSLSEIMMEHEEQTGIEQVVVEVLPDGRMGRAATARYIGCAVQTLAIWSIKGIGPRPIRIGGKVFYRKSDVDRFISGGEAA